MAKQNTESPWNPGTPVNISAKEYERQVVAWLQAARGTLQSFQVRHLKYLSGPGGDYEFDAVARFTILHGAEIIIVIECKRYSSPVERKELLALWAKKEDVNADKAMMFATCGFQSGALIYARAKHIATVAFVKGDFLYETKAPGPSGSPPPWASLPDYAGILMRKTDKGNSCIIIDETNIEPLSSWLESKQS